MDTSSPPVDCTLTSFSYMSENESKISKQDRSKHQKVNIFRPVIASMVTTLASLVIGAGIGYPSTAIPNLNLHNKSFKVNQFEQSWIGSLYFLGAVPGALLSGWAMDRFGRKTTILFSCLPHVIGWVLVAGSVNVGMMYAGRFLTGFCFGLTLSIVGVYISEIAPPKVRGILMSFHELALNVGALLMYVLGAFINWNWLAIVCAALLTFMAVALLLMPESPRWLTMNNEKERAAATLVWIRGRNVDITDEIRDIEESVKDTKDMTPYVDFFKMPLLKCFLLTEFLCVLQEMSGINVVRQYTVTIFQEAKTNLNPNIETIIVGLILVAGSTIFTIVVEKRERRVFLLISSMMMALSLAGMGIFFEVRKYHESFADRNLFWLPVLTMATTCLGYVLGVGPMPYVVTSEVFPNRARGRASSMGVATLNLFGFLITKYFVNLSEAIGEAGAFFFCAGICTVGFILVIFIVPETKGKRLEFIENELISK